MTNFLPRAFFRGEFVDFDDAKISIATHGLQYGTGAFAGLRGEIDNKTGEVMLFRLEDHIKRLLQAAKILEYNLEHDFVRDTIIKFVHQNQPTKPFYIRPFIYTSENAIAPRLFDVEKDFNIYGLELGDYLSPGGITCCISSWQKISDNAIPLRAKISGTYISSALAKTEAHHRGFDEAILLNDKGVVSEASAMNIFIVRDGALITPPTTDGILEGITRKTVLELAEQLSIPVIQRSIDKNELLIADEVFLTGTAAKITPVNQIEQYFVPSKEISQLLKEKYIELVQKNATRISF
jgi:branched-chain amino acid aminotransferase